MIEVEELMARDIAYKVLGDPKDVFADTDMIIVDKEEDEDEGQFSLVERSDI